MDKNTLRNIIKSRKKQFSEKELQLMSIPITQQLRKHPLIQTAHTILLYYSLPDEVNTHNLVQELYQDHYTILLPKTLPHNKLELRRYEGPDSLRIGNYHILEPIGPLYKDYEKIDLAIVPGMSFDAEGNRLGRGKGYYDRLLTELKGIYKIGICFDFQLSEDIPTSSTDIPMDEIITSHS